MVGKIGEQLVFYQGSPVESWGYSADEARRHINLQKAWSFPPGKTWRIKNKHSPVLLQLSSNFENCHLASRSEMRFD